LFLGRSRWSLGLFLFLELLFAPPVFQGSVFLLFVHISCVKSSLLELFYHIEDVHKEGGDKPRPYKLTYQCRGGVYLRLMGWVVVKKS